MAKDSAFSAGESEEHLLQLALGYIPAALIGVIIELGIPDLLADDAKPIAEIASTARADEQVLYRILRTLASFGIFLETADRRFALTSTGRLLRSDLPDSQRGYVRWTTSSFVLRLYSDLMNSAKTAQPAVEHVFGKPLFGHLQSNPELSRIFNDGMTSFSQIVTTAVLEAYDFSGIKVLADIAGGEGALLAAILRRYPEMRGLLLEQEHVVAGARKRLERSGLSDRCNAAAVDFFKSVPAGADAYLMKSIIHDWDDERAITILRNCHEALRNVERGRLVLVEPIVPPGNQPHMSKLADIQMLVMTGGRERTREEFQRLFGQSGFRMTTLVPTQSFVSVVEAVVQ